jgi:hypothetical protein
VVTPVSGPEPATAFAGTARAVRDACAGAVVRAESFARPLAACDLARCRGTCCTHGVTLNDEEALVLTRLARRHADALGRLVPDLPPEPVVRDASDGPARTALKPRTFRGLVPDYPAHFPDTACAFLGPTARCALQDLAAERGEAPWTYKPLACWLHPIQLSADEIRLPDEATDPYPGGFASRTPCGRSPACGGAPAHEVLAPELEHLGRWLGRELRGEAAAAAAGGA